MYSTVDTDIATNHGVNEQTNYELKPTHRGQQKFDMAQRPNKYRRLSKI
jgi:hypothetical protein